MKDNEKIIIGVVILVVVGAIIFYSPPVTIPDSVLDTSPENIGTVGVTTITCPEGFTVISTVGGTVDTIPEPVCKAPNPSLETFECGASVTDVNGMVHTIECTIDDSSTWSRP